MLWNSLHQASKSSDPGLSLLFVDTSESSWETLTFRDSTFCEFVFPAFVASLLNSAMKFWNGLFVIQRLSKSIAAWRERLSVAYWSLSVLKTSWWVCQCHLEGSVELSVIVSNCSRRMS